ncbi:MAG: hypothetical protein JSV17_12015 [Candidatus Aminicenantes bacterium]|nr:MAG: hypothetical protein JSV17_12015 [Candidatus Aminicenantes bacterium]
MIAAIEIQLELERSPEEIWEALTDPVEISGWFGDSASFSPELGSEGWFEWTLIPRDDGGTTLMLKETGFTTEESREENVDGWEHELGHMKKYLLTD